MKWERILVIMILISGGIVSSQGGSFARWSEFKKPESLLDFHAELLLIGGLGVFFAGLLLWRLIKKMESLEKELKSISNSSQINVSNQ
jgi:hypothetical protein